MSGLATRRSNFGPRTVRGLEPNVLKRRPRRAAALDAARTLTELAPASEGWSMPQLDGVAQTHLARHGDSIAAAAGAGLLRSGLASGTAWRSANGDAVQFVRSAITDFVERNGGPSIRKKFRLQFLLTGTLNEYSQSGPEAAPNRLYLIMEPSEAGYLVIGPALRVLEREHPRLPATFVHLLSSALYRWMRVYDHRDAREHVDRLREWYDSDPECAGAETPDVEASVPASVAEQPLRPGELRKLLPSITLKPRAWVERAVEIERLSRSQPRPVISDEMEQELGDCNPPLPSLLIVFAPGDNIEACFDAEAQSMMELPPEPNLVIPVDATSPPDILAPSECCEPFAGRWRRPRN